MTIRHPVICFMCARDAAHCPDHEKFIANNLSAICEECAKRAVARFAKARGGKK